MEGFGSILSALVGTCHGTTSYSNMMGFIIYTGVSRRQQRSWSSARLTHSERVTVNLRTTEEVDPTQRVSARSTQVASRVMWQLLGVMLMLFGVFNKFGAFITLIPDPIIGALVRSRSRFQINTESLMFLG